MARKQTKKKSFTEAAYIKRNTSRKQTAERHKNMRAITIQLKIQKNHLNKTQRKALKDAFQQGKYLRNWAIAQHQEGLSFSVIDTTIKSVPIKIGTDDNKQPIFEERSIASLGSQIKQGIVDRLQHNETAIIKKRMEGEPAGDQRFKSTLKSIYLKQYGNTFVFDEKHRRCRIQCIGWLRVNGGKQLLKLHETYGIENVEVASANLLQVGGDYYLHVSVFVPWLDSELDYRKNRRRNFVEETENSYERCDGVTCSDFVSGTANIGGLRVVALDLGVGGVKGSDGSEYTWCFPETGRLKAAQRKNQAYRDFSERVTGCARNSVRQRRVLDEEYFHLGCRKDDAANKFVAGLLADFDVIIVQDDALLSWREGLSDESKRLLHHSLAGRIKSRLLCCPRVIVVDRFVATTRVCGSCLGVVEGGVPVDVRRWRCSGCGAEHERDYNATDVMKVVSTLALGEYATLILDGASRSTDIMREVFRNISSKEASKLIDLIRTEKNPGTGRIGYQTVIV